MDSTAPDTLPPENEGDALQLLSPAAAQELAQLLDGRWGQVRATTREYLRRTPLPQPAQLSLEDYRALISEQLRHFTGPELGGLGFPQRYGGAGDVGGATASFSTLGYGDASFMVKVGVQFGLFGGAIVALGTERHHERYLPPLLAMELPGCFAMTESGHGSDVQHLRTTATFDVASGSFVLQTPDEAARKDYIGNAARDGRAAVVFAQLYTDGKGRGVHAFVVPIRDEQGKPLPHVRIEDCGPKGGLNGVDNGRLWFDGVRVPREALLDRYGQVDAAGKYASPIESDNRRFFTMLGTLIRGRISVAGGAVSVGEVALTIALRYAQVRRQFFSAPEKGEAAREMPLLEYPSQQRKLLPALATTYALRFAQDALVAELDLQQGPNPPADLDDARRRALETRAAGLKAYATWHTTHTVQLCREACGGNGYLAENRLVQLKADSDVFTTFEGDNTVLTQLVAKAVLTQFKDDFASFDVGATLRLVGRELAEVTGARQLLQRLQDVLPGREEKEKGVRDRSWQLEMFAGREQHVLESLARRLRGAGPDAVLAAQNHFLTLGHAHTERLVMEELAAAVESAGEPSTHALLSAVCDLHALGRLELDRGWFLEHGFITPARSKAITRELNAVCAQLVPHVPTLLAALQVPEECVSAPIAMGAEAKRQKIQAATSSIKVGN